MLIGFYSKIHVVIFDRLQIIIRNKQFWQKKSPKIYFSDLSCLTTSTCHDEQIFQVWCWCLYFLRNGLLNDFPRRRLRRWSSDHKRSTSSPKQIAYSFDRICVHIVVYDYLTHKSLYNKIYGFVINILSIHRTNPIV